MKQGKTGKSNSKKKAALIVVCIVCALILAVLIFAAVYMENLFGKLNRPDPVAPEASPSKATEPVVFEPIRIPAVLPSESAEIIEKEDAINILLVGADAGANLSDTMMMVTVDKTNKEITLTSFLRDSYVDIPGYFPHKLNTAYSLGGFELLDETLAYNFGIQFDGNVCVNFESFVEVIDAVGGVDVELTYDEASYLNGYFGWDLIEGMNHLEGEQALQFSRIRALDSDINRANRQRIVITALLNKAKSLSVAEMNTLINTVLPMITTDLTNAQITSYALELLPMLKDLSLTTQQIPAQGTYNFGWTEVDGGMSILEIFDFETNAEILKDILTN